jgi:exonuclease SbcD
MLNRMTDREWSLIGLTCRNVRFLHTSDWHLGCGLHGRSLFDAHRTFLGHICEVASRQRVDAVLVSGDVYDRAVPPPDAVGLWDEVQTRLATEVPRFWAFSRNEDMRDRCNDVPGLSLSASS